MIAYHSSKKNTPQNFLSISFLSLMLNCSLGTRVKLTEKVKQGVVLELSIIF